MRADPSSFTLVSPGYRASAGRLAVSVGAELVAELDDADLVESWQAAEDLSPSEAAELTERAGLHLIELLDSGLPAVDLCEAVTDAAVVFLIAMKQYGIADPRRIPACTVRWSLAAEAARVQLAS
jgi:hypothetical protein